VELLEEASSDLQAIDKTSLTMQVARFLSHPPGSFPRGPLRRQADAKSPPCGWRPQSASGGTRVQMIAFSSACACRKCRCHQTAWRRALWAGPTLL